MGKRIFKKEFAGRELVIEVGEIAKQASGSVLVRYDDTVILSTAGSSKEAKDLDFFPLTVIYEEKLYSVGKIPGGFLRREGRPSEHAVLTSRLIDRPLRPLFADGFRNEVQVVNTVLSVNTDATPEMSAMLGASLAVCVSDIPFNGPIAGVYVARVNNEYIINPSIEQMALSDIELIVAGTKDAINMVEAGAKEVSEEAMLKAIMFGHEAIKELVKFQEEIIKEVGKAKKEIKLYEIDNKIKEDVEKLAKAKLIKALHSDAGKLEKYGAIDDIKLEVTNLYEEKDYKFEKDKKLVLKQVDDCLQNIVKDEVRRLISEEKIRPDGRKIDEIRPLNSQIDLLPRTHGSALFTRGETQVISIATLGVEGDEQIIDNLTDEGTRSFMHHYNFPPYSVGEVGRMGSPGRREIGHGALGERALSFVIPSVDVFPYTIRMVSEVLESNGSSSQASICASSMALMAAGVPISAPVSGIAMGLVTNGKITNKDSYTILSDIQGMEDHLGDMDFKVAGTPKGITALQMDIKINGINEAILDEALKQAKIGREVIMANMMATIDKPRNKVGKYAPKVELMQIEVDKIRDVIGGGGKTINDIIEKCDGVKIDISQEGKVSIYHNEYEPIEKARKMIIKLTRVAKVGEIYNGKVVRIENYGAFVEIFEGTDGMVHVSKIAHERIENPRDVLKVGQFVKVVVTEVDEKGRVNLSMKDLIAKKEVEKKE